MPPRNFLPVISDNTFISKPLIVAVNGIAYAYGWLFAQMCDLCISSGHATFSISEAKVGRGMLWTAPLTRMLPRRLVMELLLTGVPISAQRAYDFVYVNALVPVGQLRTEASRMASAIAEYGPLGRLAFGISFINRSTRARTPSIALAHSLKSGHSDGAVA